jgi:predicted alpha/beta-fold hydrolase
MPVVESAYRAPRWLRSGHLQTVLPLLMPRWYGRWTERERIELPDGDFLDLAWRRAGHRGLAILSHGLEGSSEAIYVRGMADTLAAAGWDVLAWNFRGCGEEPNRLARSYHSGASEDLRAVVDHAAAAYSCVALVGFSLGGNLTLKYLGEAPPHPAVRAAAAISAPVDLTTSAQILDDRPGSRIYLRRFLRTLIAKTEAKARHFPETLLVKDIHQIRTIRDFDHRYTAPLHGFLSAEDYWARASALPVLEKISVPALLLNALDDPLLGQASFPEAIARRHASFFLEAPAHGGHVGFMDFAGGLRPWHERRVVEFLSAFAASAPACPASES